MQRENYIIGWGLSGAVLAWQMYFEKRQFSVYDNLDNHCTRVAAGLVNPIVFKRLTKSWKAEELMSKAASFYQEIEGVLDVKLLSNQSIYRVLGSVEEQNNWYVKSGDKHFSPYMKVDKKYQIEGIDADFGWGKVKTFGNLNTTRFLDASKAFFTKVGVSFLEENFEYDKVDSTAHYFFCEGVGIKNNPYFNYLPMKPTHGELLIIESKEYKATDTVNKNMFIMPLENGQFKVGATYNWELDEPLKTKEGREELVERLNAFTHFNYSIVDQQAGIRPTVSDRRPLLGTHPENSKLHIFNGMGTKGVLIAPFFASQLLDFVFDSGQLDHEVDIRRFDK